MATTIDNILNKIAELEAKLQESGGVNSEEILEELRILKEMLKDGYNVNLGDSFSAKTIGPAIATGVEILTPSRVVELVHETGENRDLIISQYGVTKTLENYATKDYVGTNGGKIDNISIDGVIQEIDKNKNVNIKLENYATKDFVATNGGKIDTVSIGGETLPIDDNKNVEIPTTDEPEGLDTYETEGIDIEDSVTENSSNLITSGAVYNAINEVKNSNDILEWKFLGQVKGTNTISIASVFDTAKEYKICISYTSSTSFPTASEMANLSILVTKPELTAISTIAMNYFVGARYNETYGVGASAKYNVSNKTFSVKDMYFNGDVATNDMTLFVWYR